MSLSDLLFVFITAGAGALLGSYLREKGRNYATKEDVRILTGLAEDVKAEVSAKTWLQQRRWDLKRDLYWRLLEHLDDYMNCLTEIIRVLRKNENPNEKLADADRAFRPIFPLMGIGHIILSDEAIKAFYQLAERHAHISESLKQSAPKSETIPYNERIKVPEELRNAAGGLYDTLINAAKKDLLDIEGGK